MIHLMSAASTTIPTIPGVPSIPTLPGSSSAPLVQGGTSTTTFGPTGGFGLASVAGILVDVLAIVVVLALVGVFVIIVVANRADPDPTGRRPQSVYFFAVSFVTIVISTIASTVIVASLARLIGSHSTPIADSIARAVVLGGLTTLIGIFLLVTHLRRGLALALAGGEPTNPSRRVGQSYVSAIAFVAVLIMIVFSVLSIYLVFALAGPGIFGSFGGHTSALRYLVDAVYVDLVAGLVLWTHRNLVPPGLHLFGNRVGTIDVPRQPPTVDLSPLSPLG